MSKLDKKTISAIAKEKEKFNKKKKDGGCDSPLVCNDEGRELDDIRIAKAANGYVVHPSWPADEFLANDLDEAFAITREFFSEPEGKKKNNLSKKK